MPRSRRHRTAIATAAALGFEDDVSSGDIATVTPIATGSSERVRSHTRHRAAIAESRALWEDGSEVAVGYEGYKPPSCLRRVQSLPNNAMEKDKSCAGRPKRHQRSLERSMDKGWFA